MKSLVCFMCIVFLFSCGPKDQNPVNNARPNNLAVKQLVSDFKSLTDDQKREFFKTVTAVNMKDLESLDKIASQVDFNTGKLLTHAYLLFYENMGEDTARLEKSVYFKKSEVERLLTLAGNGTDSGLRVYFAKYPNNYTNTDPNYFTNYQGRNTVVLRAVDSNGDDVVFGNKPFPAENIGKLCPPKCDLQATSKNFMHGTFSIGPFPKL
ncbi:MAG: hypothetical protein H6567_12055 [Lewinellaceae bacterium]|nr:hypothetical protein [Lewinellaceae bacterium]